MRFYYNPKYKYTNRKIIDLNGDLSYRDVDYVNIDSPDTINGHIIYTLAQGEQIPTYVVDNNLRYFVTGITQKRTGKFQISLLRDVISESPDIWKNEEAYVSAGTAYNYNKYKRWGLPFTNTKISQQRLNINGKSSFFVFYVNEQEINNNRIEENDLEISGSNTSLHVDYSFSNLNQIPSYEYVGAGTVTHISDKYIAFKGKFIEGVYYIAYQNLNNGATINKLTDYWGPTTETDNVNLQYTKIQSWNNNVNTCKSDTFDSLEALCGDYEQDLNLTNISTTAINNLEPYVNKIILDSTNNKVYTIKKTETSYAWGTDFDSTQSSYRLIPTLSNSYVINWPHDVASNPDQFSIGSYPVGGVSFFGKQYVYTLEEIPGQLSFDFNFVANTRKLSRSAVRCVNILSGAVDGNNTVINDEALSQCLMLAQRNGINVDNTTGRILDIQFLPFSIAAEDEYNTNIKINNTSLAARFITTEDYMFVTDLPDVTNIKKETDTIKIVSPSRASQFLFRPYDNNGTMKFLTRITLKPYSSVIYVRPSTEGLLMYEWDDKDCLIINEDFSLTNVTSEWTNYIYNNRNYLNSFEREMQGRAYTREWEQKVEQAQARSDEWTARNVSATKARTYTGNLPLIGDIASAIGTAWVDQDYMNAARIDREYNQAIYEENISLSRDLFNYQLDNLKSQPGIPSRITTIDCKFLDGIYLEFYSTNETELNAIDSYYYYNGNRIDDYGTFNDYWGHFIRGKIIISENYTQPELNELNRRLEAGIFTGVQYD